MQSLYPTRSPNVQDPTEKPPFSWPVRVYYEDTDAGGVVYYANYLKFMERARTEFLRSLGYEQDDLRNRAGVIFIVRRVTLDYLRPARLDDVLQVTVSLSHQGGASVDIEQELRREADGVLCARGLVKVACVSAQTLRPERLPEKLVTEFANVR